jgi:hypothetical protein
MLGAKILAGTEISHELVTLARSNCESAGVEAHIVVSERPAFDRMFDLVIANILAPVLHDLMPDLARHVSPGGRLILAGFVAKDRLPIRHYPNRDPIQMIRRCALRRAIMEEKSTLEAGCIAPHWKLDWEEFVVKQDDPGLHYWAPDTRFELVQQADHWKRVPSWKRSLRNAPLAGPLYNAAATISDALRRNKVFRSALRPISPDRAKVIARAMQAPNRDIF